MGKMVQDETDLTAEIYRLWPNARVLGKPSPMIDPTPEEIAAIEAASPIAGEYLESIGKTDLATMDEGEWLTFIEVVVTAYQDSMLKGQINATAH